MVQGIQVTERRMVEVIIPCRKAGGKIVVDVELLEEGLGAVADSRANYEEGVSVVLKFTHNGQGQVLGASFPGGVHVQKTANWDQPQESEQAPEKKPPAKRKTTTRKKPAIPPGQVDKALGGQAGLKTEPQPATAPPAAPPPVPPPVPVAAPSAPAPVATQPPTAPARPTQPQPQPAAQTMPPQPSAPAPPPVAAPPPVQSGALSGMQYPPGQGPPLQGGGALIPEGAAPPGYAPPPESGEGDSLEEELAGFGNVDGPAFVDDELPPQG